MPVIGFLSLLPEAVLREQIAACLGGLAELGFTVGTNVAITYGWANGEIERLAPLARELVRIPPSVIIAGGGTYAAEAAKAATSTIPIVFSAVSDPVKSGLVRSFNRPGGNITGVSILSHELDAKRLEIMNELIPGGRPLAALINPKSPTTDNQRRTMQEAASAAGRPLVFVEAGTPSAISDAFETLARDRVAGLVVGADAFFAGERLRITALAAQYKIPGIYQWRQFVRDGGLASYGPDFSEAYRQAGVLAGRILRGAKPGELPVLQPTKFELTLNLGVAKALGLAIPSAVIARADELIE